MWPPPALPLRGKATFSKYGVGFSRTWTVSPAIAASSAAWTVGEVAAGRGDGVDGRPDAQRDGGDERDDEAAARHGRAH